MTHEYPSGSKKSGIIGIRLNNYVNYTREFLCVGRYVARSYLPIPLPVPPLHLFHIRHACICTRPTGICWSSPAGAVFESAQSSSNLGRGRWGARRGAMEWVEGGCSSDLVGLRLIRKEMDQRRRTTTYNWPPCSSPNQEEVEFCPLIDIGAKVLLGRRSINELLRP